MNDITQHVDEERTDNRKINAQATYTQATYFSLSPLKSQRSIRTNMASPMYDPSCNALRCIVSYVIRFQVSFYNMIFSQIHKPCISIESMQFSKVIYLEKFVGDKLTSIYLQPTPIYNQSIEQLPGSYCRVVGQPRQNGRYPW